jgi:hypothetical protein
MVPERKEVARFLVQRGCQTDLLLAAALGDRTLVERHLSQDPECIRLRVSDEYFPMIGKKNGGTIYQWHLGWYVSAHDVARKFGHDDLYHLLLERSPTDFRFAQAGWEGDAPTARTLLASHPNLVSDLKPADRRLIAHAARNNDLPALSLFLEYGFSLDARSQHGATALHWAAYHGNAEMVRLLLSHRPAVDVRDEDFSGTALGWTIHGSENSWQRAKGDYGSVAEQLIHAGWKLPEELQGSAAVQAALRRAGVAPG